MSNSVLLLLAQSHAAGPAAGSEAVPSARIDPMSTLTGQYGPLFMTIGFAVIIALAVFALATFLGPKNPTAEKMIPYESGSETTGAKHVKLSVKFYLTALLFVVFDIEAVFLYPWAVLYQSLGWFGFVEMLIFLIMLTIALVYCWKKGALEWET